MLVKSNTDKAMVRASSYAECVHISAELSKAVSSQSPALLSRLWWMDGLVTGQLVSVLWGSWTGSCCVWYMWMMLLFNGNNGEVTVMVIVIRHICDGPYLLKYTAALCAYNDKSNNTSVE